MMVMMCIQTDDECFVDVEYDWRRGRSGRIVW